MNQTATLRTPHLRRVDGITDTDIIDSHICDLRFEQRRSFAQREILLARFADWIAPRGLLDVDPVHIKDWLTNGWKVNSAKPWQASSQHAYRTHLASFYAWCVRNDYILRNPMDKVSRIKVEVPPPRPMGRNSLDRALDKADTSMTAKLLLAAYAGLRCCEIAAMQTENIVVDGDWSLIVVKEQKGGGTGTVPVAQRILDHVPLMPATGWWFPDKDPAYHVTASLLSGRANRFLHNLGIKDTMHSLRHLYGTELLRDGHDLRNVAENMRHKSVTSTQRYTEVSMRDRWDAIRRLDLHGDPAA